MFRMLINNYVFIGSNKKQQQKFHRIWIYIVMHKHEWSFQKLGIIQRQYINSLETRVSMTVAVLFSEFGRETVTSKFFRVPATESVWWKRSFCFILF